MKALFALTLLLGLNVAAIAGETCTKEKACTEKKECSKDKVCEKTGEKMAEKTEKTKEKAD